MGVSALLAALDNDRSEVGQAVALLTAAGVEAPEALSIGEGDRRLLALCRSATGVDVDVIAVCPTCGELSEAVLSPDTVPAARPRLALLGAGGGLREPTYDDLRGLPTDADAAVAELLARCIVGVPSRAPVPADLDRVDDSLSGPVLIACSACDEPIAVDLDVERAVLERLSRRAEEIDLEVHLLASAYHWSLDEIEALGESRRGSLARFVAEAR